MDFQNLFNSYVAHGLNDKLNNLDNLNAAAEWEKFSTQNVIPNGWAKLSFEGIDIEANKKQIEELVNQSCTEEKLAKVGYIVGQMLGSNKLCSVSSWINSTQAGGAIDPSIDIYKKYITMTPYKNYKMIGGCSCGETGCSKCEEHFINLLI